MTPEHQKAHDEALRRIEMCRKKGKSGTVLDLSRLGLRTLPSEIVQLSSLKWLDLWDNRLGTLPPEIAQLSSLTKLDLGYNQLSALPSEIFRLSSLTQLDLWNNQLCTLPPEIVQLSSLTQLDLGRNQLSALQPEIFQLSSLTQLDLSGNQLSTLPPEIFQLSSLTQLDLGRNQLSALPPEIVQLSSLTQLDLSGNQLTTLQPEIFQLFSLTRLYLGRNQLSKLPSEIVHLSALTHLYLGHNQLSTLPPEIFQLSSLTQLDLENNQLSTLPPEICQLSALTEIALENNQLSTLPPEISQLPSLSRLFLHGNPSLKLPEELLGPTLQEVILKDSVPASAQAILAYYFGRRVKDARPLNEVKLILVGRGGAGKTSTVRALRGDAFDDDERSTPGIALCDWELDACRGGAVTAHVWDFAGQVITHALHQFFFSTRSVYLLVLTGRENSEREDAEYWLRLIKAFGTDEAGNGPPVIVVLNKWDVPGCRPRVDRAALQERYPFIRGFVEADCLTQKGIPILKKKLCTEVSKLKWVRDRIRPEWDEVRNELTGRKKKRVAPHITYSAFRTLCQKHGIATTADQDSLAENLHGLGIALNYRNDPRLREATVLQPQWLTKNVYALMRRAEKQAGILTEEDVAVALRLEKDLAMRDYLVRIMERFEIAYSSQAAAEKVWLVPQALPDSQPPGVEVFRDAKEATRLRYTYPALPEGLVARAVVRLHEFIAEDGKGKKLQWASGAVLERNGARALLRAEPQERAVMVTVTGPEKQRQELAGLCQAEMRDIHHDIDGLDPAEETLLEGTWISTETLRIDEQNGIQTGISTRDRGTVQVDPEKANNAYTQKPARVEEVWKPTAFISYSKSNVTQRKRLESELKVLMNEGLLAKGWHDRMIGPGDEWDKTIQRELAEADIVIFLLSTPALATDYIRDHEIPKAMELHNSGKAVVVPVVLEACRWSKGSLGPLQALPDKGKPLNKWTPRSGGWYEVANGLAAVCKKLQEKGKADPGKRSRRIKHEGF